MLTYTPKVLAEALYAYMDKFEIIQEDASTYDQDGNRRGSFKGRHVLIGAEVPNIAGFAVAMHVPVKELQLMYESPETSECPFVRAIDIFKAFMETYLASAAAFGLINAAFARDMMKQWLKWQTDTIVIDDKSKELSTTEAAVRIAALIKEARVDMLPEAKSAPKVIEGTAEVVSVPHETSKKETSARRARK